MNDSYKSSRSFQNLEAAKKKFPKVKGPHRILVLNTQGLPIMQMSSVASFAFIIDDEECAEAVELARDVYSSVKSFRGIAPSRVAFFFDDEVITVERNECFILLMYWDEEEFKPNGKSEKYIRLLENTLKAELT
ncbi:MAG: hypothetical protein P9X24_19410 [Candidatus Hatepunaea meridiana]|nr:hypothetical protein [Candidatus Hatepunaea meridiana]